MNLTANAQEYEQVLVAAFFYVLILCVNYRKHITPTAAYIHLRKVDAYPR